jgi:LmbE family N-acetylglucosaminyl deacetylase
MLTATMLIPDAARAAGPPAQPDAARIQLALRKLGVVGSVLYVAAHPDDENTNLLAYLANEALLRTGYLSLTRGDGGQNLIGAEQGPALGLIRTQELLAARRIDGAEQLFSRARDFGYSKTPDETLRIWGKEAILADVVAAIRRFRPDVIITRFSPEPSDTHGHHTASAMLAAEAFRAAADPAFHPEQLTGGVTPWQARRLLWNRSSWNIKPGEDMSAFVSLDVGGYNPLLGLSYGEMAADSRSMHKSQGFGVARERGPIVEYFKVLAEAPAAASAHLASPLAGIDVSWGRFAGKGVTGAQARALRALPALVDRAQRQLTPAAPHAVIPTLLEIDEALDAVPDAPWREQKRRELHDLVLACAGLFADATAADFRVAPGGDVDVTAVAVNRSPVPFTLRRIRFPGAGGDVAVERKLATSTSAAASPASKGGDVVARAFEAKRTIHVPADAPMTTPYWLEAPPEAGLYPVARTAKAEAMIGRPEDDAALSVELDFEVGRRTLAVVRPVTFKWTDPVAGERYRPLEITPAVSVRADATVLLFPDPRPRTLSVRLAAGAPGVSGVLRPSLPPDWTAEPTAVPFALAAKGDEVEVKLSIHPAASAVATREATLRLEAEVGGVRLARGVTRIEHAHIPIQTVLADATVRIVPLALETGATHIAYIPGAGDEVAACLRRVGYDVTVVGDEALAAAGAAALARFDAVVVGVRAFNTSDRLRAAHAALMSYVQGGGTLVVQYNTNSRLGPLSTPIGPYPLEIGHDRVTDETARVTFTDASSPVLKAPNPIGARDFDGWVQERGLYFASTWDPRYETPLAMNDPGERPLQGSLLVARYGKGTFVYTGLSFFRQLPAGVPGAFRLFANLINAGGHHGR